MKKIASIAVAASLALAGMSSAQADWGRHHYYRPDFRPPVPVYRHHHHEYGRSWVGPAAVLTIAGLALGAAAYSNNVQAAPAPVYVVPPPVYEVPPPSRGVWYYCGSAGQYYPYTNACPEGWQVVPAR